jgi:hypothetical protein
VIAPASLAGDVQLGVPNQIARTCWFQYDNPTGASPSHFFAPPKFVDISGTYDSPSERPAAGTFDASSIPSAHDKLIPFPSPALRSTIMKTLVIKNLAITQVSAHKHSSSARSLSHAEMKSVQGGRAVAVLVDGRPGGVVDDFDLNMAIFRGDIGVKVV